MLWSLISIIITITLTNFEIYLVIKCFPSVIVVGGFSHKRIRHREAAKARIVQVTERVGGNLRHELLHHRRAGLPLRRNNSHGIHLLDHLRRSTLAYAITTPTSAALLFRRRGEIATVHVRFRSFGRNRSDGGEGEESE